MPSGHPFVVVHQFARIMGSIDHDDFIAVADEPDVVVD
jgi:hypothetical protein